jgi:Zn-dependent peptidase ImmA (M78 family)
MYVIEEHCDENGKYHHLHELGHAIIMPDGTQ